MVNLLTTEIEGDTLNLISSLGLRVLIGGGMLSERKREILRIIAGEYITTATPVASETIARKYSIGLSSATIRNEMARLEEEGYITRPHASSGGIPSDKGYRYYVETLIEEAEPSLDEQRLIHHLFHQVDRRLEEWVQLSAAVLSRMAQNVAIVTIPKAQQSRLKHLELISVQDFLGLLVIILREAKLKQQFLSFDEAIPQGELDFISNRLNSAYLDLTWTEIIDKVPPLSPIEELVTEALVRMMQLEDKQEYEDPYLDGLRHILSQPEFSSGIKMLSIMEIVEGRSLPRIIPPQVFKSEGVHVIIGGENQDEAIREFSVVATRYGIPDEMSGVIGVLGPKRMPYTRTISMVRYLGSVMSGLVSELYR